MKIQTKIALLFAALTASLILLISGFAYYTASQNAFDDFYKRLDIRAVVAAKVALEKDETNVSVYDEIRSKHLERLPSEKEYIVPALAVDSFVEAHPDLSLPRRFYKEVMDRGSSSYHRGELFYAGIFYHDNQGDFLVILSAKNDFSRQYLADLRKELIISIVLAVLLSFVIGLLFSREILQPIRRIAAQVQNISAQNLHLRLSSNSKDELGLLTETFNDMLDRLETAFETQNNFVSNASHELNTPLTSIIGEGELALSRPRDAEAYAHPIRLILAEAEKLRGITRSLLSLAQTGFNGKALHTEPIRCDELLYTVKKTVENIIPDSRIFMDHSLLPEDERKLIVTGNRQLLELAFTNIVLNACKYSSNKPVQLLLAATGSKVIVLVRDEGIGIPHQEVRHVFEPFFRASNTGRFAGYGIGLPLSRNIIRMHKGDIIVKSEEHKGTEIKVSLPVADA